MLHNLDPLAFSLGPLQVHWYGIMYLLGFASFWLLGMVHAKRPHTGVQPDQVSDILFYGALGAILGGRIGYALFYQPLYLQDDPWMVLRVWEGGMSFHGGLLGVLGALWLWQSFRQVRWLTVIDFCAPLVPIGLFFGRIGNFINGELWGHTTTVSWGVIFPRAGPDPRHPSQLYEAALEGLLLFAILWWFARTPRRPGQVAALFALGYAVVRFAVEFVRVPDTQLGYVAFGWLTMGQLLCVPLALLAALLALQGRSKPA